MGAGRIRKINETELTVAQFDTHNYYTEAIATSQYREVVEDDQPETDRWGIVSYPGHSFEIEDYSGFIDEVNAYWKREEQQRAQARASRNADIAARYEGLQAE